MFKLSHNGTVISTDFKTADEAKAAAEKHELHDGHPIPWGNEYKCEEYEAEVDQHDENGRPIIDKDGKRTKVKVMHGRMTTEIDTDVWVGGWWRIDKA